MPRPSPYDWYLPATPYIKSCFTEFLFFSSIFTLNPNRSIPQLPQVLESPALNILHSDFDSAVEEGSAGNQNPLGTDLGEV